MADIVSHKKEVIDELERKVEKALTMIGLEAERFAKSKTPVDTGYLRNSITWALDGEAANTGEYRADKAGKDGEVRKGQYEGTVPKEGNHARSVYVGTNVEYAPSIELGSSRNKTPRHMLQHAAENHMDYYKGIMQDTLKE